MSITSRRVVAALLTSLTAALVLAGCSSAPETPPRTADQVVAALATKVPTAKAGQVITAQNDPNKLLGRPGQYTSAAVFTDSRIPADSTTPDPLSVDNGGKVEVFASEDEAHGRHEYIQQLAKSTPLAAEYDYLSGTVLVRVSKTLTPDQAKQYEDALGSHS